MKKLMLSMLLLGGIGFYQNASASEFNTEFSGDVTEITAPEAYTAEGAQVVTGDEMAAFPRRRYCRVIRRVINHRVRIIRICR